MSKIKGWEKSKDTLTWTTREKWLQIIKREQKEQFLKYWDVDIGLLGYSGVTETERFMTKKEAYNYAISYMRGWC